MRRVTPPTLKELLDEGINTDTVEVSKRNYKKPTEPEVIYTGSVNEIPEDVLKLKILAWIKSRGVFIAE